MADFKSIAEIVKKILSLLSSCKLYILVFTLGATLAGGSIYYIANRSDDTIIRGYKIQITKLNGDIGKLRANNDSLTKLKDGLVGTNSELTKELKRRQVTIDSLGKSVAGQQLTIAGIESTNRGLQKSIGNLEVTNRGLQESVNGLEKSVAGQLITIGNLEATNQGQRNLINGLEAANRERQAFIDNLAKSAGDLGTAVERAGDDISKIKVYLRFALDTVSKIGSIIQSPTGTK